MNSAKIMLGHSEKKTTERSCAPELVRRMPVRRKQPILPELCRKMYNTHTYYTKSYV